MVTTTETTKSNNLLRAKHHLARFEEYISQPLGCVLISPDGSNDHSVYVPQRKCC